LRVLGKRCGGDSEAKRGLDTIRLRTGPKVAANDGGRVAVEDVGVGVRVEAGRRLDGRAAFAGLAEDIGDGLGVYASNFDGNLKPVAFFGDRLRRGRL
jgi:hypothetical protein